MSMIEMCQECGAEIDRKKLVRKIRAYGYGTGSNLLLYSSYNSDFWSCDAVDEGEISMGVFADHFRPYVTDGTTVTEARGSQTWSGASGTFYSITATDLSAITDAGDQLRAEFLAHVRRQEDNGQPNKQTTPF